MAGSFSNSWALVKASAGVLKMDKELVVFPLMSGIATVLVIALSIVLMNLFVDILYTYIDPRLRAE